MILYKLYAWIGTKYLRIKFKIFFNEKQHLSNLLFVNNYMYMYSFVTDET